VRLEALNETDPEVAVQAWFSVIFKGLCSSFVTHCFFDQDNAPLYLAYIVNPDESPSLML